MSQAQQAERYLRRVEASKHLLEEHNQSYTEKTLAKIACTRCDGPPYFKCGRFPYYPVSGLDRWAISRRGPLVTSTAEARGVGQSEKKAGQAAEREIVISAAAQHRTT
jgi:hypothetical protein